MKLVDAEVAGTVVVIPEPVKDERGLFARMFCRREFAKCGLNPNVAQCSLSFNPFKGTLRGLHYQVSPYREAKLIRCSRGGIWDVVVDLRRESPTYRRWFSIELTADNRKMLYIPEGCAHGFLTLTDDAEVLYQISEFYSAEHQRGVRWNDPQSGSRGPPSLKLSRRKTPGFPTSSREAGNRHWRDRLHRPPQFARIGREEIRSSRRRIAERSAPNVRGSVASNRLEEFEQIRNLVRSIEPSHIPPYGMVRGASRLPNLTSEH